jgi:hypothetical protein
MNLRSLTAADVRRIERLLKRKEKLRARVTHIDSLLAGFDLRRLGPRVAKEPGMPTGPKEALANESRRAKPAGDAGPETRAVPATTRAEPQRANVWFRPHARARLKKIISGGQTGADLAGLDWALSQGVPHGGWCAKGRLSERGPIPDRYQLEETETADYQERTRMNILASDGTVVFSVSRFLIGGAKLTYDLALRLRKPVLHLHAESPRPELQLAAFVRKHGIQFLNVAGSRASQEPTVGSFVANTLDKTYQELKPGAH